MADFHAALNRIVADHILSINEHIVAAKENGQTELLYNFDDKELPVKSDIAESRLFIIKKILEAWDDETVAVEVRTLEDFKPQHIRGNQIILRFWWVNVLTAKEYQDHIDAIMAYAGGEHIDRVRYSLENPGAELK